VSRAARGLGALVLLVLLAGCTSSTRDDAVPGAASSSLGQLDTNLRPCPQQPDQHAAGSDLPATVLQCFGGGTLDLGRAPGAPTVLNLWASWCGPCREELPLLQQLADRAGDRLQVVGVISKDGAPQAESFAEDADVTFASAFDGGGDLMAQLGLNVLPVTYLVDADGGVVHVQLRPVQSMDELASLVAEHLGIQL
jgi:thiol-disulfide isomerase/thioredoxin